MRIYSREKRIGKKDIALRLAFVPNCTGDDGTCNKCSSCSKIFSGNHPDIKIIENEGL